MRLLPTPVRVLPPAHTRPLTRHAVLRRALLGAGVGAVAALMAGRARAGFNFFTGQYTITHDELQQLLIRRFPLAWRRGDLFSIDLSDPLLGLNAAANRLAITAHVTVASLLLPQPLNGQITLGSALRYDPSTLTLRLEQPDVEHIAFDGLDNPDEAKRVQDIASAAARELLQGRALHTFRPGDLTVGPKTYAIGDITVHEDGVSVQLK